MVGVLKEFFIDREMEVEVAGDVVDLLIRDGRNVVGVKIIDTPLVRDEVERLIARDLSGYDKVYIAVPSRYMTLLPPLDVFKAARLGVLEVTREGVRIVIAAPFRGERRVVDVGTDVDEIREIIDKIGRDVERLQAEVRRLRLLEERVNRLEEKIDKLVEKQEYNINKRKRISKVDVRSREESGVVESGMPSFVADNPWLKVLSKRSSGGE